MTLRERRIRWLTKAGLVLLIAGYALMEFWGGVLDLQSVTGAETLASALDDPARNPVWASLADLLVFVPGYLLLFGGLLVLVAYRNPARSWRNRFASAGVGLVASLALVDQVENVALQIALRGLRPDRAEAETVASAVETLQVANLAKNALLIAVAAVLLGLAVPAVIAWLRRAESR